MNGLRRQYQWMCENWPGGGEGGGQWQGIWELGKPSAVHIVLSAFLISVLSESALAKFSRKLSTKYSLSIQGASLISPSDLDKSEAWKQGNPDVSIMKWSSGAPNIFPEVSIQTGDCMPLFLPVAVWGVSLALKGLAQWPSTSAWCCFLPPSGPQGSWVKALSRYKVGFLAECQPQTRQDLTTCPKSTKFFTVDCWEWGWCSMYIEDLIVSVCKKCLHHIVSFTKMIHILPLLSWLLFLVMDYFLMRIFWNKTLSRYHLFLFYF